MRRVLFTGASGQLGAYLLRQLRLENADVVGWSGSRSGELFGIPVRPVDLCDELAVANALHEARPDVVLHAGAIARVADCHRDPARAQRVNVDGARLLARLAADAGARFILVSSDLVFDGVRAPYREDDPVCPLSVYGRTKAEAEKVVLEAGGVVARLSLLFGPSMSGRPSFFDDQITALRAGKPLTLFTDEWRTPLDLNTAATALTALARSDVTGLLHIGGPERLSRFEMGARLAAFLRVDTSSILAVRRDEIPVAEPRPCDTSLDASRWRALFPKLLWPTWEDAMRGLLDVD